MKSLLVSSMVLVFLLCGSPFKLAESTSQEWAGGLYESGYGTNFKLTLVAKKSSDKLQVQELWIGDTYFEVQAVRNLARKSDTGFAKGDTLYVVASINLKPDKDGKMVPVTGEKRAQPEGHKANAVLGYTWKGKKSYLEISDFKQLEKLIYP